MARSVPVELKTIYLLVAGSEALWASRHFAVGSYHGVKDAVALLGAGYPDQMEFSCVVE